MFFVMVWWVFSARKWFKGPIINVEHHMLRRQEDVVVATSGAVERGDSGSDSGAYTEPKKAGIAVGGVGASLV
jgi:hypothetical protein